MGEEQDEFHLPLLQVVDGPGLVRPQKAPSHSHSHSTSCSRSRSHSHKGAHRHCSKRCKPGHRRTRVMSPDPVALPRAASVMEGATTPRHPPAAQRSVSAMAHLPVFQEQGPPKEEFAWPMNLGTDECKFSVDVNDRTFMMTKKVYGRSLPRFLGLLSPAHEDVGIYTCTTHMLYPNMHGHVIKARESDMTFHRKKDWVKSYMERMHHAAQIMAQAQKG
uniref:Uncharacterized protein n=1 Tax=Eutreptiella gymnastica TaxID=73025 RepID=A0A7S1J7D6_9EUGL